MDRIKAKLLILSVLFVVLSLPIILKAESPLDVGKELPRINLEMSNGSYDKYLRQSVNWLGLLGKKSILVEDIDTEFVLIEIFSMYCPYCQAEAPQVNALFAALEASPKTKGRIKLIGIGAGNTAFEVEIFRKKYAIAFPLFPDGDFSIHKKIGEVRTPYFILVKQEKGKPGRIVFSKLGSFGKADSFINTITGLIAQ